MIAWVEPLIVMNCVRARQLCYLAKHFVRVYSALSTHMYVLYMYNRRLFTQTRIQQQVLSAPPQPNTVEAHTNTPSQPFATPHPHVLRIIN